MKTSELQNIVYRNFLKKSKIVPEWNAHLDIFSHIQATENSRQYLFLRTDILEYVPQRLLFLLHTHMKPFINAVMKQIYLFKL